MANNPGDNAATKSVTFPNEPPVSDPSSYDFVPLESKTDSLGDVSSLWKEPRSVKKRSLTSSFAQDNQQISRAKENLPEKFHLLSCEEDEENMPEENVLPVSLVPNIDPNTLDMVGGEHSNVSLSGDTGIENLLLPQDNSEASSIITEQLFVLRSTKDNSQASSIITEELFVLDSTNNVTSCPSMQTDALITFSLSESSNSGKSTGKKQVVSELRKSSKAVDGSSSSSKYSYSEMMKLENNSPASDHNSDIVSLSSSVRRALAFSSEKGSNAADKKDGSSSLSLSMQSTLDSGSFSIRKIVDKKEEFSRNISPSSTGTGAVLPQFSLTSLSSVSGENPVVADDNEDGPLPSCPSSYTDPSFKNISGSSVSKLLGSTFKKTEKFLKKLERLDFPGGERDVVKRDDTNALYHLYDDKQSEPFPDESNKLHFISVSNEEDGDDDGEVLQLSDNEVLVEQDIESASLADPYLSDTTADLLSQQNDNTDTVEQRDSGITEQYESGAVEQWDSGTALGCMSKLSEDEKNLSEESQLSSERNEGVTVSNSVPTPTVETIREVLEPLNVQPNPESSLLGDGNTDTSVGIDTPRYLKKDTPEDGDVTQKRVLYNISTTSTDSENSERKIPRRVPIKSSTKKVVTIHTPTSPTLTEDTTITDSKPRPLDLPVSSVLQNIQDSSEAEYPQHSRNKKPSRLQRQREELSRDQLLDRSLTHLLKKYDSPLKVRSDSPLMRKLELLSNILKEAKMRRSMSCTSDSSDSTLSGTSVRDKTREDTMSAVSKEERVVNMINKEVEKQATTEKQDRNRVNVAPLSLPNSTILKDRTNEKGINAKTSKSDAKPEKVRAIKKSIKSNTKPKKSVTQVCPNCLRRDVGTNCPTPCVSSDESAGVTSHRLTLQTWTQTSEEKGRTTVEKGQRKDVGGEKDEIVGKEPSKECVPHRKTVIRKRWSDKENSETDNNKGQDIDPEENENGTNKRERKNTFVLQPSDVSTEVEASSERVKGSTAWFQSYRSDEDSVSVPLQEAPNLAAAYSGNRAPGGVGVDKMYEISTDRKRLTLQEAFLVHKRSFITNSAKRLQDVKDGVLQVRHPLLQKPETKRIVGSVPHGVPKRIRSTRPKSDKVTSTVPKYDQVQAEKLREKRSNRIKMKAYDTKIRARFLKRERRTGNSKPNMFFVERH